MQTTIDKDIIALEKQYWNHMKDRDTEAALKLTADPCLIAGAQGVSRVARKDFERMMSTGQWRLNDFRLDNIEVQQLSDNVAVICYKVHEDLTVDGRPVALDAADASTWVKKNGKWKCALHTESVVGDPYGRDRMAAH